MNGTITKRPTKSGKVSWGFYFAAGLGPDGKRIQVTKSGFETKREASEALRAAIAKHEAGPEPAAAPLMTFGEFFDRWIRESAGRKCSPKTLERYRELGEYALRKFGDVPLQALNALALETAYNALLDSGGRKTAEYPAGKPLSARTVRHIAFTVHGALETAVRWGLLEANPMNRVELPKAERKEAEFLERDGVRKLFAAAAGTRLFPLLVLAAATGCRRGELLALTWPDIDFETGIVTISKSLEQTEAGLRVKSTKSGKPRRFAVPAQALEVLREHRAQQDRDRAMFGADYEEHELVFCRPEGAYYMPDKVSGRVTDMARAAGLDGAKLHTLRHTHASELLSQGAPLPTVSKRLGHANPNITLSIYSHALEADELAAAKLWDNTMAEVIEENRKPEKRNLAKSRVAGELKLVKSTKKIA